MVQFTVTRRQAYITDVINTSVFSLIEVKFPFPLATLIPMYYPR